MQPISLRLDKAECLFELCRGRSIALDIAQGLFYLHKSGIVHLDIKVKLLHTHVLRSDISYEI